MTTPGTDPIPADEAQPPVEAESTPVTPREEPPASGTPVDAAPVSPAVALPPVSPSVAPFGAEPAMVGAPGEWNRGSAAVSTPYSPTGAFPGQYARPHVPGGPPPSFDTPGYGYGYAAAPAWAPTIEGPKAWPVAVFTVFFGVFGAISAARRSSDAKALGLPGGRYWGVFAGALVGSFALWTLLLGVLIAVTVPLYLSTTSTVMTSVQLETQLVGNTSPDGSVAEASCADDAVDSRGVGTYECSLTFENGTNLPYLITVSDDGSWAATALD